MVIIENKEEIDHIIHVLEESLEALKSNNSLKLEHLSNQTIHSTTIYQHTDLITLAVLVYSLNKLVTRKNLYTEKEWNKFLEKISIEIHRAINALKHKNPKEFANIIERIKNLLMKISPDIRPAVEGILKNACVKKACKIYEHGVSLEQTAKLFGITLWDLLEYTGQKDIADAKYNQTGNVKHRAKMAMEFFS